MPTIVYQEGSASDLDEVARLHAYSWKTSYRGMISETYLDEEVDHERYSFWKKRLSTPDPSRWIILARDTSKLCGFACTLLDHDQEFGALLDNLHVLSSHQGIGIGRQLMVLSAHWIHAQRPGQSLYLWVLSKNKSASLFYEKMGGIRYETKEAEVPGGGKGLISRYIWPDLDLLIDKYGSTR